MMVHIEDPADVRLTLCGKPIGQRLQAVASRKHLDRHRFYRCGTCMRVTERDNPASTQDFPALSR